VSQACRKRTAHSKCTVHLQEITVISDEGLKWFYILFRVLNPRARKTKAMFSNIARKSRSLFQEVFKQGKTAGVNTGNERERERERPSGD